jgi:hypothetical protein
MAKIGVFMAVIYSTKDKKKLKDKTKTYEYGTIIIRDPKLNIHIGKRVRIKIETEE